MARTARRQRFTSYRNAGRRFTQRFRGYATRFRSRRRRSTTRKASPMKKWIMYAVIGFLVFFLIKNKQKVTDFLKKITGKK